MKLINISNHANVNWEEKQKEDFEDIIDIPFPRVKADASEYEIINMVSILGDKVIKLIENYNENTIAIYIAGEGSLVYYFTTYLNTIIRYFTNRKMIYLVFPSTERDMIIINNRRAYKFTFNKWRKFIV